LRNEVVVEYAAQEVLVVRGNAVEEPVRGGETTAEAGSEFIDPMASEPVGDCGVALGVDPCVVLVFEQYWNF